MTEQPTDAEIYRSVARWVEATGIDSECGGDSFWVWRDPGNTYHSGTDIFSMDAALLWALATASKSPPLDTGACRAYHPSGGPHARRVLAELMAYPGVWRQFPELAVHRAALRFGYRLRRREMPGSRTSFRLACCDGTVRDRWSASWVIAQAYDARDARLLGRMTEPLQQNHMDCATVLADREQAAGRSLGLYLAHWLAGIDGWQTDALAELDQHWFDATVPCPVCGVRCAVS